VLLANDQERMTKMSTSRRTHAAPGRGRDGDAMCAGSYVNGGWGGGAGSVAKRAKPQEHRSNDEE